MVGAPFVPAAAEAGLASWRRLETSSARLPRGKAPLQRLAHAASATLDAGGGRQQGHGLKLQAVLVKRAAGSRKVIAPLAGRAGEHALAQLAVGEPAGAARAGVAVGQQAVLDAGDDQSDTPDLGAAQLTLAQVIEAVDVEPRRLGIGPAGRHLDHGKLGRAVADRRAGLHDALYQQALEVGRRLVERLFDGQLQRGCGGRAALAASLEADPGHAVLDPNSSTLPPCDSM